MAYRIAAGGLEDPASQELLTELSTELRKRYPEGVTNYPRLGATEATAGRGTFLIATDTTGRVLGCGALRVVRPAVAEVRHMYVRPIARGRGLGDALMTALEDAAREFGVIRLLLETGTRQDEALGLYWKFGFSEVGAFADYVESPLSVCMAKSLDQRASGMTATPSISTRASSSHSRLTPTPAEAG